MGCLIIGWSRPAFPDEERHLKLAPIQISSYTYGSLGYTYLSNNFGTSKTTSQALDAQVHYDVGARSFFWQPWFALVTGDVGVGLFGNATRTSPNNTRSGSTLLTGDGALDMLKYSRFPFRAHLYSSQNRASGYTTGINSDFKSSGYDLKQAYKTRSGNFDGTASYLYNENGRSTFGTEEIRKQLSLDLTANPAIFQTVRVTGDFIDFNHPIKGDTLSTDALVVNHYYHPNSAFGVASLLNLIKNSYTLYPLNSTPLQNDYNSQQFSSFASWRPIASPLTVTSSVRLLRSELSNSNSLPTGYDDTNFNLGANYAWSTLLRAYGSVNVNDNNNIQTISTNAALAAQKVFGELDAVNIGDFKYTRYAGGSIANATTTTSNSQSISPGAASYTSTTSVQNLGINLGHQLGRITELGSGLLTTDIYQRYLEVVSSKHSPTSRLNSGGTLAWKHSAGRESTILSLRASDSRYLTGSRDYAQLINLQGLRSVRLLNHQSLNGDLTVQSSRSSYHGISSPFTTTPSANLEYINERIFAVKNLTFRSTLHITGNNIVSSQNLTQINTSSYGAAKVSWDNHMDYMIGRLRIKLYSDISQVNQGTQSSLYFNVVRSF